MKSPRPLCMVIAVLMSGAAAPVLGEVVSSFSLDDINTLSDRRKMTSAPLSPRDYLHQVTAWYFGDEA